MSGTISIGGRKIGSGNYVFIIAEAGVNHNGNLTLAKRMVDAAKSAGVDAVKFQTFRAEEIATADCEKAEYQRKFGRREKQVEMLKRLELSSAQFKELFDYCTKKKVLFLSTPFDIGSAELLNDLGVEAFKISSGDITNLPLLRKVAAYGKPVILSTGMSSLAEIKRAVKCISASGNRKVSLLQCTSAYPAKPQDSNLRAILTMARLFKVPVGLSDHTEGILVPVVACGTGACIIEKHFTLDKKMRGPDHKASLSVKELKDMVRAIRLAEIAMGSSKKALYRAEAGLKKIARRSLVSVADLAKGDRIEADMITVKRPGTGIGPAYQACIIGKRAKKDIARDEVLTWKKIDMRRPGAQGRL